MGASQAGRKSPRGRARSGRAALSGPSFIAMRLDAVRRAFPSDAAVAETLGVNPAQLARWRQGQEPEPENADRLTGLDAVVEMLTGYLSPSRIPKWLHGPNAHLGDRTPLAALRAGDLPGVIAAIKTMKAGAHA